MQSNNQNSSRSKKLIGAGWIISLLPVLLLLFSGSMKLLKPPMVVEGIAHFGYPESVILILGIVELSCTAIYVYPATSVLGAILLTGYLGGATATHVRVGEPFFAPVLVGVAVWLGLFLRDGRLRALLPFTSPADHGTRSKAAPD